MRILAFFILITVCNSCFLFNNFRKSNFSYSNNGVTHSVPIVVPKKYSKVERRVDSSGNEEQLYRYSNGAVLYFVRLKDTSKQYQPIDYSSNIAKELYQTIFFKGLDSTNSYWRETRFGNFKTGYFNVDQDDDGVFDSSINYFSLRFNR